MATSPEHYQTYRCHLKFTNSKRFTDTIHFNHKKLTRSTIRHADKVAAAIEECARLIKNLRNSNEGKEMRQLIQITEHVLQNKTPITTATTTTTGVPASSRVPLYTNNNTQQTRSMTPLNPQVPQLSTPSVLRVDHSTKTKHKHQTKKHKTKFHTRAPAHNTISQTEATGPASRTRARTQLTKLENKTQTGRASTA